MSTTTNHALRRSTGCASSIRCSRINVARLAAGFVTIAIVLTACGGDDPTDDQIESAATSPNASVLAATIAYPVGVDYAGLAWSIEDTRFVTEGQDDDIEHFLHADLLVENSNPFGMRWPARVVTLRRIDGTALEFDEVLDTGSDIKVAARDLTRVTIVYEVDDEFDVGELTLTVAETDRIPATAAFAGSSTGDAPYPLELGFDGTTKPLAMEYTLIDADPHGADSLATVTALDATIGVNGPGLRARTGYRLVRLDVRMDADAAANTRFQIVEDDYRLHADGVTTEPLALVEFVANPSTRIPSIEAGGSAEFILVFEIPADITDRSAELVVITGEAFDRDSIPVEIPELPPCCGEKRRSSVDVDSPNRPPTNGTSD